MPGLQRLDENGKLESFDAYCHSTGASGWIELRDPNDASLRERVYRFLLDAKESGKYGLGYVFTKEEAKAQFHLDGPFDFIIEGDQPLSFGYDPAAPLFTPTAPGDYKTAPGTHGGRLGAIIGRHFSPAARHLKRVLSLIAPASWMKRRRWLKSSELKWKILTVIALTALLKKG